jgi:hypothetical protein
MTVKHGGCSVCKSKDQAILTTVTVGSSCMAVCDSCKKTVKAAK